LIETENDYPEVGCAVRPGQNVGEEDFAGLQTIVEEQQEDAEETKTKDAEGMGLRMVLRHVRAAAAARQILLGS